MADSLHYSTRFLRFLVEEAAGRVVERFSHETPPSPPQLDDDLEDDVADGAEAKAGAAEETARAPKRKKMVDSDSDSD